MFMILAEIIMFAIMAATYILFQYFGNTILKNAAHEGRIVARNDNNRPWGFAALAVAFADGLILTMVIYHLVAGLGYALAIGYVLCILATYPIHRQKFHYLYELDSQR